MGLQINVSIMRYYDIWIAYESKHAMRLIAWPYRNINREQMFKHVVKRR